MKSKIVVSALLCAVLSLSFSPKEEAAIDAAEAVKKGIVKIKISGKGGHSGSCMSMSIQNLKSSEVKLVFNAGRRFNSSDDSEQDLLMVRDQIIVLKSAEKKSVDLSGFCCQLSNKSPKGGSGFGLGAQAEEKLSKLAKFINGKAIPDNVVQEAVWCVSDGQDPSNISVQSAETQNEKIHSNINELRKFVCTLLSKPDPWYSTPQNRRESEERIIEANPVEVYGEIQYEVKTSAVISAELQDENHKVIFNMPGKDVMDQGKWGYGFHLKVEGYPKGKYHVVLKAGETQIMDKEFMI